MQYIYRDLRLSSSIHPATGDIRPVNDEEAIKNSLRNLLNTSDGERPFQPNLGANIYSFLFEQADSISIGFFRANVLERIRRFEPRIKTEVLNINIEPDKNSMTVYISFIIVATGQLSDLTLRIERLR